MFDKLNIARLGAIATGALMLCAVSGANAAPFDANFDSLPTSLVGVTSLTNAGFTFTFGPAGDGGVFTIAGGVGEGSTNALEAASNIFNTSTTEEISIVLTAGGNFTFDSIWFDSFGPVTTVIGMLGATTTYSGLVGSGITTLTTGGVTVDIVKLQSADFGFLWIDSFKGQTPDQTAVPEPGTLALFGLGLAGLGFARRRKIA